MSVTMVLNSVTEEDSSTFRDVERPGGQSTSVNKTSWSLAGQSRQTDQQQARQTAVAIVASSTSVHLITTRTH